MDVDKVQYLFFLYFLFSMVAHNILLTQIMLINVW